MARESEEVTDRVNGQINDLRYLLKALDLLERVWLDVGPYQRPDNRQVSEETREAMNKFFKFNDSE